jgi:hypothetical protein
MIRSLLRKELRSLAPFLGLVLFLIALNWADEFVTKYPDQHALSKLMEHDRAEHVMLFAFAFALAAGLLVRERDEGTLSFLDALPVSRAQVFACKALPALAVLWLIPLSDLVLKVLLHHWSKTSLETQSPVPLFVTATFLDVVSCVVYFSFALALSFLRRFAFLALGLVLCAYLFLQELHVPLVPLFDILSLGEPVFRGRAWLLPKAKLLIHLSLALGSMAVAFISFQMMGDSSQRLAERLKRRRGAIVLTALGTAAAVLVWVGLFIFWSVRSASEKPNEVHYETWPTSRANTARYQFLYRENEAGKLNQLLSRADAAEARVRTFLSAAPISRIEADLTGSAPRTAGVAHWKTVQMDLAAAGNDAEALTAVLGHETTHVYIDHEGQSRLEEDFNSTRFFHEGLASYVEYHLFRPTNQLSSLRRVAAVMRSRREVTLEELLDSDALTLKRDTDLVYPLGEVFVDALVQRYGESAPGKVVKAFARPNAPRSLHGVALWQDVLQACGYNLSAVEDVFYAELDRALAEQRQFVENLPRLRGAVMYQPGQVTLRAAYDGRAPGRVVCRFRSSAETPARLYHYAFSAEGDVFSVSNAHLPHRSFWYQLGWRVRGASQTIWEPWVEALK